MIKRKLINLSLVASLLMTAYPLSANNSATEMFRDLGAVNLQNNVTGFQEFRGANGEMVYGFGGSLVVKRPQSVYPQWYHFQAPEISASCSGISFKGMFGSIINFDELEKQFSEAGESLAWGILVGIIYSLPGIGELFSKLDAWAKKIQQMLANACRSGIAIGKAAGTEGLNAANEATGGYLGGDPKRWLNKIETQDGSLIQQIDTVLDCAATSSEWISAGECPDIKKDVRDQLSTAYLSAPSVFASAAFMYHKEHNSFPFQTTEGKFTEIDPSSSMELSSGAADFYNDLALAMIITSVVGDVVINEDDYSTLEEGMKVVYDETNAFSPEERQKILKGLQSAMVQMSSYACTMEQGDKTLMNSVAHYLVYGDYAVSTPDTPTIADMNTTSSSSSSAAPIAPSGTSLADLLVDELKMPNFGIFQSPGSTSTVSSYQIIAHKPFTPGGLVVQNVIAPIENYTGAMELAVDAKNCYLFEDAGACSRVTYSLFDLNAQRFLAKVYRNTLDPAEKGALESRFLDYAIYHMAEAIKDRIRSVVNAYAGMTDIYNKEGSVNATNNTGRRSELAKCMSGVNLRLKEFSGYMDDAVKQFKEDRLKGLASPEAVYELFLRQNRSNMQHALERLNRK